MVGRHKIRVFPDPSQTGPFRPGLFHDRPSIDIRPRVRLRREVGHACFQLFEFLAHYLVIVLSPGIPGDATIARLFVCTMFGEVGHTDGDDRSATRKDLTGIRTFLRCPFQPGHGPVMTSLKPLRQAIKEALEKWRFGGRKLSISRSGGALLVENRCDPDGVKSQRSSFLFDDFGERHERCITQC